MAETFWSIEVTHAKPVTVNLQNRALRVSRVLSTAPADTLVSVDVRGRQVPLCILRKSSSGAQQFNTDVSFFPADHKVTFRVSDKHTKVYILGTLAVDVDELNLNEFERAGNAQRFEDDAAARSEPSAEYASEDESSDSDGTPANESLHLKTLTRAEQAVSSESDDEAAEDSSSEDAPQKQKRKAAELSGSQTPQSKPKEGAKKLRDVEVTDLIVGTGPVISLDHMVTIDFKFMRKANGKVIEEMTNQSFVPSTKETMVEGLRKGMKGMRVGGHRSMDIPSHLAFGEQDMGEDLPPNSDLTVTVKLLKSQAVNTPSKTKPKKKRHKKHKSPRSAKGPN